MTLYRALVLHQSGHCLAQMVKGGGQWIARFAAEEAAHGDECAPVRLGQLVHDAAAVVGAILS